MLRKGAACLHCRKLKEKCDGSKPSCSRCWWYDKECVYATGIARRRPVGVLETRALELERTVHRLTLASTYELSLASAKLLARIRGLGDVAGPKQTLGKTCLVGLMGPHLPLQSTPVDCQLSSSAWGEYGELPPVCSLHLINLFLQHHELFGFFTDVPRFLHCVSLPSDHPDSIHPCLLNACYLGACFRGSVNFLEAYFIRRARHFLQQALMYADHITHFLWASVILGCYFARKRRLEESFAVSGAAAHLAFACGLSPQDANPGGSNESTSECLLPPPTNATDAIDRIRLALSIYLLEQESHVLGGPPPSFPYDDRWALTVREASLRYYCGKESTLDQDQLSELWHSDLHFKVSMARLYHRVLISAQSSYASARDQHRLDIEYVNLSDHIDARCSSIPPLRHKSGGQSQNAHSALDPRVLSAHTYFSGNGLVLHAVRPGKDAEARRSMLKCVETLLVVCNIVQADKGLQRRQAGMMNITHMMNAVRVVARELQRPDVRDNPRISADYCSTINVFLNFIENISSSSPEWVKTPAILKESLTAAAESLMTTGIST